MYILTGGFVSFHSLIIRLNHYFRTKGWILVFQCEHIIESTEAEETQKTSFEHLSDILVRKSVWSRDLAMYVYSKKPMARITKTLLFKYIENSTSKNWKFSDKKNSDSFHISAQNMDCRYSLEPPRRGGSNEYPQSMFFEQKIRQIMYTPANSIFTI